MTDTTHPAADDASADTTVVWLIHDISAEGGDAYMSLSGTWVNYDRAGNWTSSERAARALLLVDPDRFDSVELVRETREREVEWRAADVIPPSRQFGIVPSAWLSEAGNWGAKPMLDTLRLVEARNISPQDLPEVMAVYEEVRGFRGPGQR